MAPDIVRSYSRDFWKHQDNNVMVISEKSTIAGVVMPVLDELGVKFLSAKGFCSATAVHDLAKDIANDGRFTTILYIGDWDPSGLYMSEVDFPARLGKYGAGLFHFERIALSRDDCVEMAQTPFPAKEKDRRYAWFAARAGKQCWELDALDPNDLRDRVRAAVWEYIDEDEWNHHKLAEAAEISTLKTFVGGWQEALRQQGKD